MFVSAMGIFLLLDIIIGADHSGFGRFMKKSFFCILAYCMVTLFLVRIYYAVKFWSNYNKMKDHKIALTTRRFKKTEYVGVSPFIRGLCDIFTPMYLFSLSIWYSKSTEFLIVLYRLKFVLRWMILVCFVIAFVMMIYSCLVQLIHRLRCRYKEKLSDDDKHLKKVMDNDKFETYCHMSSLLFTSCFYDEISITIRLIIVVALISVPIAVFQFIAYKYTTEKGNAVARCFVIFIINIFFVLTFIQYTNFSFNTKKIKTFDTVLDSNDYSTTSGKNKKIYIRIHDPETADVYRFHIGRSKYTRDRKKEKSIHVIVYKGLWGFHYAQYEYDN